MSEFNPTWLLTFTPIDPDDCTVEWFLDTQPAGTHDGPSAGGARIYGPEVVKTDCTVEAKLRYNEPALNQHGATDLFLRIFDGNSYSLSHNIGIFDPQTGGPSELIIDTDKPVCVILQVITALPPSESNPDTSDLPIGLYKVQFDATDNDSTFVLPIPDDKVMKWEVWTGPNRTGDKLGGDKFAGGIITTDVLADLKLQDEFKKLLRGGENLCVTRYVHIYDSGCNEVDTPFEVCLEPFTQQIDGEYLVQIVQSTNHEECKGVEDKGSVSADGTGVSHTDQHPELNLFTAATAYYPDEDHGQWTFGNGREQEGDNDSEAEGSTDEGSENEDNSVCHWVNIHFETAPPPAAGMTLEALRFISQATCHDEAGDANSGDYVAGPLTPSQGNVLDGSSQTFSWDAQPGATGYGLAVSSTDGSVTYFTGSTTDLSITATGLPTDGSLLHVGFAFDQGDTIPPGNAYDYIAAGGTAIGVTHGVCMNIEIVTDHLDTNCSG